MSNLFICSSCHCIESTSLADFFIQVNVKKQKPLCCKCSSGEHHNTFPQKVATIKDVMDGDIIYFEDFKHANVIKNRMISVITNYGRSILPKDKFDKMSAKEILTIYRRMIGKTL